MSSDYQLGKLKREFKARCKAARLPCHICRQPIDYAAPRWQPDAFEADHIQPIKDRPDLKYEPSNLAPAHCSCNRSRGARAAPVKAAWQPANW